MPAMPLVLALSIAAAPAWLELGDAPDQRASAIQKIERLLELDRAVAAGVERDFTVERMNRILKERLDTLDPASLYAILAPDARSDRLMRSFEIRGQLAGKVYRLSGWRRAPKPELFGDSRTQLGLSPSGRPEGFVLTTNLVARIDDLGIEHLSAFSRASLGWWEALARAEPAVLPESFDQSDFRFVREIAESFPRTARLIDRYVAVEDLVAPSPDGVKIRLRLRLKLEAFEEQYPELAKVLSRSRDLLNADLRMVDRAGRQLSRVTVDSKALSTTVEIAAIGGRLRPLSDGQPAGEPIDLFAGPHFGYDWVIDARSNLSGLIIQIRELTVHTEFERDSRHAAWSSSLNRVPSVSVSGALGVLPLWLVNALIPSDIEALTRSFFATIAGGNRGRGLETRFEIPARGSVQELRASSSVELPSSGFLRFALRMARSFAGNDGGARNELSALTVELIDALRADFSALNHP